MLHEGFFALLTADATFASLVGTNLYPVSGVPDQQPATYVTYQDITGSSEYTLDGAESRERMFQFNVWAPTYNAEKLIFKAMRTVLSGFTGTLPDADQTRVMFSRRGNESSRFDQNQRLNVSFVEYEFQISET